jgi:hypothetical protein
MVSELLNALLAFVGLKLRVGRGGRRRWAAAQRAAGSGDAGVQ